MPTCVLIKNMSVDCVDASQIRLFAELILLRKLGLHYALSNDSSLVISFFCLVILPPSWSYHKVFRSDIYIYTSIYKKHIYTTNMCKLLGKKDVQVEVGETEPLRRLHFDRHCTVQYTALSCTLHNIKSTYNFVNIKWENCLSEYEACSQEFGYTWLV